MKNFIYCSLIIFSTLSSCKKDIEHTPETSNTKREVSFFISSFTEKGEAKTFAIDSLPNISIYIFKMDERVEFISVQEIILKPDTMNIKYNLEPGTYRFVFIAATGDIRININHCSIQPYPSALNRSTNETFFEATTVTVGETNVSRNIILKRLEAQLEFEALDKNIPDSISKIRIVYGDWMSYDFNGEGNIYETRGTWYFDLPILDSDEGRVIGPKTQNIMDVGRPIHFTIEFYNQSGQVFKTREIYAEMYKNRKTIVRGYLLDQSAQMSAYSASPPKLQ